MSINSDLQAARAMFNPSPVEVIKESVQLDEAKITIEFMMDDDAEKMMKKYGVKSKSKDEDNIEFSGEQSGLEKFITYIKPRDSKLISQITEARTASNSGKAIFDEIRKSGVYWTDALPEALNEWEGYLIDFLQTAEDDKAVKANIEIVKKMIALADKFKEME